MKRFLACFLAFIMVFACTACGNGGDKVTSGYLEKSEIEEASIYAWKDRAENGSANDSLPEKYEVIAYGSLNEMLLSLGNGRIDYFDTSLSAAKYICDQNPDFSYQKCDVRYYYKMAVLEENRELRDDISEAIAEIRESTKLYDLMSVYIADYENAPSAVTEIDPALPTYRVGITGDLPPMDYISADGTPGGFNVALLNVIGKMLGLNFEFVSLEAAARTTALVTGKIDIIFCESVVDDSSMSEYVYQEKTLLLTDYYYCDSSAAVTKEFPAERIREMYGIADKTTVSQDDLAGKKIGAMENTSYADIVEEKLPDSFLVQLPSESLYDGLTMMLTGDLDAMVDNRLFFAGEPYFTILGEPLYSTDICFALPLDHTALAEEINQVVAEYEKTGIFTALYDKWCSSKDLSQVFVAAETDYAATNGSLKMAFFEDYVPYIFFDGEWKGYEYELALMIGKELGYAIEPVYFDDWQAGIDAVISGEIDILSDISRTPQREAQMLLVTEGIADETVVAILKYQ